MRTATINRKTGETDIHLTLALDGRGVADVTTGLGFLDHMLTLFAHHGLFDLTVQARAICTWTCTTPSRTWRSAWGRRWIGRWATGPASSARPQLRADGRGAGLRRGGSQRSPYAVIDVAWHTPMLGAMDTDLVRHFLETVAVHGKLNLHARVLYGRNDHHQAEALFKALGRALDAATQTDPRRQGVPSTKGTLA